ncbi:Hypothetical predicted protein [Paramuricea clavata]|uniref:Discoidin domain-containing protein n=1 Tax=Paramuricea clavata TaxID=317549 RepID=A0A6S7LBR5_PARCT|nr:Hypothetical predicted protein [Paramuricea clavata]
MATSKISESCVCIGLLALTSVTYALGNSVILSYSMPVGQATLYRKAHYIDESYNGVIINNVYKDGTGILTDGQFGPVKTKSLKGKGWVGWSSRFTKSQYINITFEFSGVRKFTDVTLTVNVKKRGHAVFNRSWVFFASTADGFSNTSFLQQCPRGFPGKKSNTMQM